MKIKIINKRTGANIASRAKIAKSFLAKAVGLLLKKSFEHGEGLVFERCNGVHTLFLRFELDLIYVNKEKIVTKVIENFPKGKFSPFAFKASDLIELPAGTIKNTGTMIGDQLFFEKLEQKNND